MERPHLKSTIEIQDPYAKGAAGGSGKRKLEDRKKQREKEKEGLYIAFSLTFSLSLSYLPFPSPSLKGTLGFSRYREKTEKEVYSLNN